MLADTEHHKTEERLSRWRTIGIITICIRLAQGWVFWGGGSRRIIYAPSKLNPHAPSWMANKLQAAMPGAVLGMQTIISFLLHHFVLLYASIILLSVAELVSGLALIVGAMTRLAAFITVLLSIVMMVIFGWQGATCIDEWTISTCNLAMGITIMVAGSSAYSIDSLLLKRYPVLQTKRMFALLGSGPWTRAETRHREIFFALFFLFFLLGSYNYYRGAIFSSYHAGPVSSTSHHLDLSQGTLTTDGAVSFKAYVDGGTPGEPAFIIRAVLKNSQGQVIETWDGNQLSALPATSFNNEYNYNRFETSYYGLSAPVGSRAVITLTPKDKQLHLSSNQPYALTIYMIDGRDWTIELK